MKKKIPSASYFDFVKKFITNVFGQEALAFLDVDLESAAFYLGSFIYPKYMIKCLNEEMGQLDHQEKAINQ